MRKTLLAKAGLTLLAMLFSVTGARAIVTHTVYDGTATNERVPVYGSYVGNSQQVSSSFIRSQFIIPKDQLAIMKGGHISHMIFYASQEVVNWYTTTNYGTEYENIFDVYVSETDDTGFTSASYKKTGNGNNATFVGTKVYTGKLAVNGHQLIVDFTSDFPYSGNKNLLIGIYQTKASSSPSASTFLGQSFTSGNYYSVGGYSSSSSSDGTPTQYRFIPKTTFVYTPGFIPTNIEVTKKETVQVATNPEGEPILAINATLGWEGDADSYEIRYRTKRDLLSQNFNSSSFPSGWTRWKKGEAPSSGTYRNGWGIYSNAACSYSWLDNTTYDADNWLISPKVELGGILKFKVGVTAWHDIYEVKVATTATVADVDDFTGTVRELAPGIPGIEDFDLKDYSGQEGYIAIRHKNKDGYYLTIDDFELSAGHAWKYATTTTNSVVLEHLLPDLVYEYVVVGIKHDAINDVDVRGEAHNSIISATHVDDVIIPDDEDNESLVYDMAQLCKNGTVYNAYLESRTFRDNGIWNTLTLPFDVTVAGSPFEDALIYTVLDRSSVNNDVLTLRIDPATPTKLLAGTPYLITWEGAKTVSEPFFPSVTFKNETHPKTGSVAGGTSITFTPNFNFLNFATADESVLFLSSNHLYSAGVGATIKPQRAYFKVNGANSVRGIAFEIVDDADVINDVNANLNGNENIFNVAGQRLGKMQKGINIVNGKKIIIK